MLRAKCNGKLGRAGYRVDTGRGPVVVRSPTGPGPDERRRGRTHRRLLRSGPATGQPARRAARRRIRGVSGQTRPRAAVRSGRRTAGLTAGRPQNRRPRSPERIPGLRAPAHCRPVRYSPAGTIRRPGCHPGRRRPADYHRDRMGTIGTGQIPSPGGKDAAAAGGLDARYGQAQGEGVRWHVGAGGPICD